MAIVFVATVAAIASSVVVIKQSNRIAKIERKIGSGSVDQVAAQADRDAHNLHFSLPSPDSKSRIDGVLTKRGTGFLLGGDVKDAPSDVRYQLWADTSAGPVSLGLLDADVDDAFAFHLPDQASGLFVTAEAPTGAVSPSPSVVVKGALPAHS